MGGMVGGYGGGQKVMITDCGFSKVNFSNVHVLQKNMNMLYYNFIFFIVFAFMQKYNGKCTDREFDFNFFIVVGAGF